MDFSKIKKIYMIGIKGVGMTMLAQFLVENGYKVSGSDVFEKFMTDFVLKKARIKISNGFDVKNIPKNIDLIIYSTAYNSKINKEVEFALNSKIKTLTYAETIGDIFNKKYGIAIIGSHGKTTTTAWLGYVLEKAGKCPNVMVGANVKQFNGASLTGKSDYLIIEADEYQNKLKYFSPNAVLLNNIDYDHPDFFKTDKEYKKVFADFVKKIPKSGFLVANFDDSNVCKIAKQNCNGKIISYAIDDNANYVACDVKQKNNKQYFKVKFMFNNRPYNLLGNFCIQLSGKHNISNALAVIVTCVELDVDIKDVKKYLEEFKGTVRRMEKMGEFNGAIIVDDYAHHPTEIIATLAGAREIYKNKKIITVFHPHTFTRTKAFFNDFVKSFKDADEIIVLDIYGSAREKFGGVHSRDLVDRIRNRNKELGISQDVKYIATLDDCEKYLRENIQKDDVVLLMGAGDVFRIGEKLVSKVKNL